MLFSESSIIPITHISFYWMHLWSSVEMFVSEPPWSHFIFLLWQLCSEDAPVRQEVTQNWTTGMHVSTSHLLPRLVCTCEVLKYYIIFILLLKQGYSSPPPPALADLRHYSGYEAVAAASSVPLSSSYACSASDKWNHIMLCIQFRKKGC